MMMMRLFSPHPCTHGGFLKGYTSSSTRLLLQYSVLWHGYQETYTTQYLGHPPQIMIQDAKDHQFGLFLKKIKYLL